MRQATLNIGGHLLDLTRPKVMGILNVTPDSFYGMSRAMTEGCIERRVRQIADEGGAMVDIGAFSTRPGHGDVSAEEEMGRLRLGMRVLRGVAPDMPVSVDTFRADVARMAVEELGADAVNDVTGGSDGRMGETVARLGVPYVLTYRGLSPALPSREGAEFPLMESPGAKRPGTVGDRGSSAIKVTTKPSTPEGGDGGGLEGSGIVLHALRFFSSEVQRLRDLGVKDIVIDPGFGFGKTLGENYELLWNLDALGVLGLPILAGVSRKSMIYNVLGVTPDEALNGTTVVNAIALMRGASILRVHDVREAVEAVRIMEMRGVRGCFSHKV